MDVEAFLTAARELLAVESTGDRPAELHRALGLVLDFVGPGFSVEWFESGGKPSALVYRGITRPRFSLILNAHLDVVPAATRQFRPYRDGDRLYARGAQDMKVSALVQALVCNWSRVSPASSPSSARPAGCASSPSPRVPSGQASRPQDVALTALIPGWATTPCSSSIGR
jgi:Peptidase family M20/M25/M40